MSATSIGADSLSTTTLLASTLFLLTRSYNPEEDLFQSLHQGGSAAATSSSEVSHFSMTRGHAGRPDRALQVATRAGVAPRTVEPEASRAGVAPRTVEPEASRAGVDPRTVEPEASDAPIFSEDEFTERVLLNAEEAQARAQELLNNIIEIITFTGGSIDYATRSLSRFLYEEGRPVSYEHQAIFLQGRVVALAEARASNVFFALSAIRVHTLTNPDFNLNPRQVEQISALLNQVLSHWIYQLGGEHATEEQINRITLEVDRRSREISERAFSDTDTSSFSSDSSDSAVSRASVLGSYSPRWHRDRSSPVGNRHRIVNPIENPQEWMNTMLRAGRVNDLFITRRGLRGHIVAVQAELNRARFDRMQGISGAKADAVLRAVNKVWEAIKKAYREQDPSDPDFDLGSEPIFLENPISGAVIYFHK